MFKTGGLLLCLALVLVLRAEAQNNNFPFWVPWDSAPSGVADMSMLLRRPVRAR